MKIEITPSFILLVVMASPMILLCTLGEYVVMAVDKVMHNE